MLSSSLLHQGEGASPVVPFQFSLDPPLACVGAVQYLTTTLCPYVSSASLRPHTSVESTLSSSAVALNSRVQIHDINIKATGVSWYVIILHFIICIIVSLFHSLCPLQSLLNTLVQLLRLALHQSTSIISIIVIVGLVVGVIIITISNL